MTASLFELFTLECLGRRFLLDTFPLGLKPLGLFHGPVKIAAGGDRLDTATFGLELLELSVSVVLGELLRYITGMRQDVPLTDLLTSHNT